MIILLFLIACQPHNIVHTHGIAYLDKRQKLVIIDESNKNDVIKIFGQPATKGMTDDNVWIYIERTQTREKILTKALRDKNIWESDPANQGKDFRDSEGYQDWEFKIIQATNGKIKTKQEATESALEILMLNNIFSNPSSNIILIGSSDTFFSINLMSFRISNSTEPNAAPCLVQ